MKRILFSLILLFALVSYVGAQTAAQTTVSGYFTETTQPAGNVLAGQTQYHYGITATAVGAGDTTYAIASKPFSTSSTSIRNGFFGYKIPIGINITIAFADVNATLVTQISYDGTNWVTLETLDADTTPNVTGVQSYVADFSTSKAPYARICFNAGNLQVNKTGRIKFMYASPY